MSPKKKKKLKKSKPMAFPPEAAWEDPNGPLADQLQEMGDQLEQIRIWGHAGGGLVKVEMNGLMEVLRCQLAPELLEKKDRELIEDLLVSAFNDAGKKARERMFVLLLSQWGEAEQTKAEENLDIQALSQDEDFMSQMGDPLAVAFMEMLASLEEDEDQEEPPPKRGGK